MTVFAKHSIADQKRKTSSRNESNEETDSANSEVRSRADSFRNSKQLINQLAAVNPDRQLPLNQTVNEQVDDHITFQKKQSPAPSISQVSSVLFP